MATTETEVPNYDFLQFINSNFADLVSHYVNMWASYHQAFSHAAMGICLWGGLAWVGVLTVKAPADKLKTAASAFGVVMLTAMLLQPGTYSVGPAGTSVGLSAGAGWSIRLVGNIYQLFKSALDSVNQNSAMALAINNAFHVTDEATLAKFKNSPVQQMYQDYIEKCQSAVQSMAGQTADTRKLGQSVGLFGSSGVNQPEVAAISEETYNKLIAGDKNAGVSMSGLFYGAGIDGSDIMGAYMAAKTQQVQDDATKAQQMLLSIPTDLNPFDGKSPNGGYVIPTKNYWLQNMFKKGQEGVDEYEKITDGGNSIYKNGALTEGSSVPEDQNTRFYPQNCLQMYMMVSKAVSNWTAAMSEEVPLTQKSAWMRDGLSAQTEMIKRAEAKIEQDKLYGKDGPMQTYSNMHYDKQAFNWGFGVTANEIMDTIQTIGMKFKQWMLTFKIPTMINGCAMLAGVLVVLFPLICVFAVFMNPSMLISYIKILAFAFTIPLINNLMLTMAATLLALNAEVLNGLNSGDYSDNFTVLISASSAQYIIFMALTTVEIIIAKMLIWDDVKGLSGFNPGSAATGMAATGGAVVGAAIKMASGVMGLVSGAAGKLASGAAGSLPKSPSPGGGGGGSVAGTSYAGNISYPRATPASYGNAGSMIARPQSTPKPVTPSKPSTSGGGGPGGNSRSASSAKPAPKREDGPLGPNPPPHT